MHDRWNLTLDYDVKAVLVTNGDPAVENVVIPFSLVEAKSLTVVPGAHENSAHAVALVLMVDSVDRIGTPAQRKVK